MVRAKQPPPPFRRRNIGGGGRQLLRWMQVIETPTYADPTAGENTEEYNGRAWYTLRALDTDYTIWTDNTLYDIEAEAGVPYVVWPDADGAYYKCKVTHTSDEEAGATPANSSLWEKQEETRVQWVVGKISASMHLRDFIPWCVIGDEVPVISKVIDSVTGETRIYILQTFTYTGSETQASLRWNDNDNRAMAVFR